MSPIFPIHRHLFILLLLTLLYPGLAYATCTYPGTGNWDILTSEDCYVNDTTITLNGNLTVYGNLTFDNVTLYVNNSVTGEHGINVTYNASAGVGGIFIVANGSNLTALNASNNWFFYVENNAQAFNMTDSFLSEVGWPPSSGSLPAGVSFNVDKIYFINNTVYSQLAFNTAHNSTISNNRFYVFSGATGVAALRLEDSDDSRVEHNFINITLFKGYGIFFKNTQRSNFTNNTVYTYGGGTSAGFFGEFSEYITLRNNSVYTAKYSSYFFRASAQNLDIDTTNLAEGKPYYYLSNLFNQTMANINAGQVSITYSENLNLINITVVNADHVGIGQGAKNITLRNVYVENSSGSNFGMSSATNIHVINLTVKNQMSVSSGDRMVNIGIDSGTVNVTIENCTAVSGAGSTLPMRIRAATNVLIKNCYLSQGSSNYQNFIEVKAKGNSVQNVTIKDTNLTGWSKILLDNNAGSVRLINTTFPSLETRTGTYAEVYWYLNVHTNDSSGNPLPNVTVSLYDVNNSLVLSELTDSGGNIKRQTVLSYNQTPGGKVLFYPYTLKGTKTGYTFDSKTFNLTSNTFMYLTGTPATPSPTDYFLYFTVRDNSENGGAGNLSVWVGNSKVWTSDVLNKKHVGKVALNITPYNPEGKNITFEFYDDTRGVILIKDVKVTYGNASKEVRLSPWSCFKTHPSMRCKIYSDRRFVLAHPYNLTGTLAGVNVTSSSIVALSPELEIKPSYLKFSKTYNVSQGESITINVTVRNIGNADANNTVVALYVNDQNVQNSSSFNLASGANTTVSFSYTVDYGTKNYVKITAKVIPEDSSVEGRDDNNFATRYLIKNYPYFFFTDFSATPAYSMLTQEPYASWKSSLESAAQSAYAIDYSNTSLLESDKAINAMVMALYYHVTGNQSYANKTMEALINIGNGMLDSDTSWIWANRSNTTGNYGWEANGNVYPMATALKVSIGYAYAYNWVRDYMETYDSTYGTSYSDTASDKLYLVLADLYLLLKEINAPNDGYPTSGNSGVSFGSDDHLRRLGVLGALGAASLTLLDYDGQYVDVEGSPDKFVDFAVKDLVRDSQAGFWKPALRLHVTRDGYYMGGDYLQYFAPSVAFLMKSYYDTFGINLADSYSVLDGFAMHIPYTTMPNGVRNYVTAWYGVYQRQIMLAEIYPDGSLKKNLQYWYLNTSRVAYDDKGFATKDTFIPKYLLLPIYNKSAESVTLPSEATYISNRPSMFVLRSGFGKKDWYSYFKIINEEYYSATGQMSADLLTFDIWAKGAYLIVDSGEPRFTVQNSSIQRYRGEAQTIGHTTVLINQSGQLKAVARWHTALAYPEPNLNRAYLKRNYSSPLYDLVEGYMYVKGVRNPSDYSATTEILPDTNKFNWTRGLVLVGDEYLIQYDMFNNSNNEYYIIIPLGSTEGTAGSIPYQSGNFSTQLDNRVYGNLSIEGSKVVWFNETSEKVVMEERYYSNVSKIIWSTFTETNGLETTRDIVNLSIFLPTPTDVYQNVSVMHYGTYSGDKDYWHPYLRIKVPSDKFVVVYSAYDTSSRKYDKMPVTLQGSNGANDYAIGLNYSDVIDIIHLSDGENVVVKSNSNSNASYNTDAKFAVTRFNSTINRPVYYLISNFTFFNYSGFDLRSNASIEFPVSVNYTWANLTRNQSNITIEADFEGSYNLTVWVADSSSVTVKRNGATYSNWGVLDSNHIWVLFKGASLVTYQITSSDSGTVSSGSGGSGQGGLLGGSRVEEFVPERVYITIYPYETFVIIRATVDEIQRFYYTISWEIQDSEGIVIDRGSRSLYLPWLNITSGMFENIYDIRVPISGNSYVVVAEIAYDGEVIDTARLRLVEERDSIVDALVLIGEKILGLDKRKEEEGSSIQDTPGKGASTGKGSAESSKGTMNVRVPGFSFEIGDYSGWLKAVGVIFIILLLANLFSGRRGRRYNRWRRR